MPIKWSAVKVSEAIDKVEQQVTLAEPFLDEAKKLAREAKNIANLPEYMGGRLSGLIGQIEKLADVKSRIESVRASIPGVAIEEERASLKHGSTQPLI
jgi:hypothetical protein